MWRFLVSLLIICGLNYVKSEDTSLLKIATIEYNPTKGDLQQHVLNYLTIINQSQADLIVFPEATLTWNSPLNVLNRSTIVDLNVNPCSNNTSNRYADFLVQFSCIAKYHKSMLVLNIEEKELCSDSSEISTNCKQFGYKIFNTDVVIDWFGTVVAKYRKFNLFGEYDKDRTENVELVTFKAKNGETFGIFTCFDIMFKSPALDLVKNHNVKNFVFPTMWFSELPFLTALQVQQMWAMENKAFFVSSGANNPTEGSGGTGIFDSVDGAIISDIIAEGGTNVYDFTKNSNERAVTEENDIDLLAIKMDGFYFKQKDLRDHTSKILNFSQAENNVKICHENLCCYFSTSHQLLRTGSANNTYKYHFVAFSGERSFSGVYNGGIEVCALVACPEDSLQSCGLRIPKYQDIDWNIVFESIEISGTFDNVETKVQFPNSLLSSMRPIPGNQIKWDNKIGENNKTIRTLSLLESQDRLMTFGIYGRNFALDHPPKDAAKNLNANILIVNILFFLCLKVK